MNRKIMVLIILYLIYFVGTLNSQDLSFYTKYGDYDATRLPLIYPYELWCTDDRSLINWTFNTEILMGIYGSPQKIFIKDQYIIFFVDKFIDVFDKITVVPSTYYINDTEKKKKKKIESIQKLYIDLKELGITDCKLESIKDLYNEYTKTGICYWFPEDIKRKIIKER